MFPRLTPEGCRVICLRTIKMQDKNYEEYDVNNFCKIILAGVDLELKEEPMYGNILLFDLEYTPFSRFLAFTPTVTKNLVRCLIVSTQRILYLYI